MTTARSATTITATADIPAGTKARLSGIPVTILGATESPWNADATPWLRAFRADNAEDVIAPAQYFVLVAGPEAPRSVNNSAWLAHQDISAAMDAGDADLLTDYAVEAARVGATDLANDTLDFAYFLRGSEPTPMVVRPVDLRPGDVAHESGMRVLIVDLPTLSKAHAGGRTYYTRGVVLNRNDVPAYVVPFRATASRSCYGVHEWTFQGNDLRGVSIDR